MDNNWIIVEKYLRNGSVEVPQGPTTKISKVEGNLSKGLVNITLKCDQVYSLQSLKRKYNHFGWIFPPWLSCLFRCHLKHTTKISCSFSLTCMRHYLECPLPSIPEVRLFSYFPCMKWPRALLVLTSFSIVSVSCHFTVSSFVSTHQLLFSNLTNTLAFTPSFSHISIKWQCLVLFFFTEDELLGSQHGSWTLV